MVPKANTSLFLASPEPCPVRSFGVNNCRNTLAGHYQRNARVPTSVWSSRYTVDIHKIYTRLSWVKQEQGQQKPSVNPQSKLEHYTDIFSQNRYCNCNFFLTLRDTKVILRRIGAKWFRLGAGCERARKMSRTSLPFRGFEGCTDIREVYRI